MKARILILFSGMLILWAVIVGRGAFVQIIPNKRLDALKRRQFETSIRINARRGAILDRNGKELAASIPSYSLFADPKMLEDRGSTATKLSRLLHIPRSTILHQVKNRKRRFTWIDRQLPQKTMEKIRDWDNPGLGFIEEPKRIYPNGRLLAQTLGMVGTDGHGLEGLELKYDKVLHGDRKRVMLPRDAWGRPLLSSGRVLMDVPDGSDVQLTIDGELQFVLEQQLGQALRDHDADAAEGIVMDPSTFQILAMATLPSGDLNNAFSLSASMRRNRAVTDTFEPGSTMKTFLMASALKNHVIQPNSRFYCEDGRFKVDDRWITEADAHENFKWLSAGEILMKSSNIGSSKIAIDLGAEKYRQTLSDFGFGQRTGVDLPGEARGILKPLPWRKIALCNISFGQGISVTPLQMVTAYATIADGGVLKKPYIVESIRSGETHKLTKFKPQIIRRVIPEKEASTLALMLTAATSDQGTGGNARVSGYPVAGKTGTAQKVDLKHGGYLPHSYIANFAGFVPAHDPRFVIYIAVDNPRKGYYGAQAAAPVFAKVAQYALRRAGIAPIFISEKNVISSDHERQLSALQKKAIKELKAMSALDRDPTSTKGDKRVFPSLLGLSLKDALAILKDQSPRVRVKGEGWIVRTIPQAGQPFAANTPVTLVLENPD